MYIYISPWINTRTYHIKNNTSSVSFIFDVRKRIYYLLKGITSNIWDIIVNTQNYTDIRNYAEENGFLESLDLFLSELTDKELINSQFKLKNPDNKFLCFKISEYCKNFDTFLKKKDEFVFKNNILDFVYLELNYKCNLKCKHCCNNKDLDNIQIDFVEAQKIIDEAYLLGIREVVLTGGECTLNKDFLKICEYIRSKHLSLFILTNGQIFYNNDILLNKVADLYPAAIKISLYSMNEDTHDFITGVKGSFKKTISVIKKFKEKNTMIIISYFPTSYNYGHFKDVEKFAMSNNLSINFPSHKFCNNKKNSNIESKVNKKYIQDLYEEIIDFNNLRKSKKNDNELICTAGTDRLSITPNLDIIPCVYFNYKLGNLKNINLYNLRKKVLPSFQKEFTKNNLKECYKYEYCEYCDYCPMIAYFDSGFMKKSSILCEDAQAYYEAVQYLQNKKGRRGFTSNLTER